MLSICFVMCTFNRPLKTRACLNSICSQMEDHNFIIVVVDASNNNETREALREYESDVELRYIKVSSETYWNRSMYVGIEAAKKLEGVNFIALINDDTVLTSDAIKDAVHYSEAANSQMILVGSIFDHKSEHQTYGGLIKSERHPLNYQFLHSIQSLMKCDTMNANFVFMDRSILDVMDNLDNFFEHSLGDIEFGLRANLKGIEIYSMPGTTGFCDRNEISNTYKDTSLSLRKRIKLVNSPKGRPFKEYMYFSRKYGGRQWPMYFIRPYLGIIISHIERCMNLAVGKLFRRRGGV